MTVRIRCRRCGECCRIKVQHPNGKIELTDEYCPHFHFRDGKVGDSTLRGECAIYLLRSPGMLVPMDFGPIQCLTAIDMLQKRLLPESCPYTEQVPGYKSSRPGRENGNPA